MYDACLRPFVSKKLMCRALAVHVKSFLDLFVGSTFRLKNDIHWSAFSSSTPPKDLQRAF